MALRYMTKKQSYLLLFYGLGIASEDKIGIKDIGNEFVYKIHNKEYNCKVLGKGKLTFLLLLYTIILTNG